MPTCRLTSTRAGVISASSKRNGTNSKPSSATSYLARLEGGGDTLCFQPVSVADLFKLCRIGTCRSCAIERRSRTADRARDPGDPRRCGPLEQAMQNLAVPPSVIRPLADAWSSRPRMSAGRCDRGAGYRPASRRAPGARVRSLLQGGCRAVGDVVPSGSGLGLSIVRAIVERHGGSVSASNAAEGGAMFELLVPSSG